MKAVRQIRSRSNAQTNQNALLLAVGLPRDCEKKEAREPGSAGVTKFDRGTEQRRRMFQSHHHHPGASVRSFRSCS